MTASRPTKLDPSVLEPLVGKFAYRVTLDAADRAALLALPHQVKTMENNHYIVREGDRAHYSCLMLSGFSVRHKTVGSGSRQIVAIHMKGEMVDLQNSLLEVSDHSVQMLTEGEVALIPRDAIVRIAREHPAIGKAMWIDTLVDASMFRESIANVGRRDGYTRLAHLLCEFALRLRLAGLSSGNDYELPMTQEQLADATGMTPVHLNRMIRLLEARGLISRSSPRAITIGAWKKLAEAGDFDSRYLHLPDGEPIPD